MHRWSYRLLVRACYAGASQTRRWAPNTLDGYRLPATGCRLMATGCRLPADEPMAADELNTVVKTATSSTVDSGALLRFPKQWGQVPA